MEQVFEKLSPIPEGNNIKIVSIEWDAIKKSPEYNSLPITYSKDFLEYRKWLKTKYIVKKRFGFMCYYNKL